MSTIDSFIKFSSPVAFVSGVEVAATAAVEVSLKLVPIGRRGGVYPVPVELVHHRGRGHRSSMHHGRAQLERGEDGSKLQQTEVIQFKLPLLYCMYFLITESGCAFQ